MKLKNVAKLFDTCPVYDAYTGLQLFKVQTSTFLESAVEGSTASRRVISAAPEHVMPSHSCILALGQLLLVGAENPDEWAGQQIRKAYWTKVITDQFSLLTPSQAVNRSAGISLFGQRKFIRETINTQTDSELDAHWDIFLSKSQTPARGMFLRSATSLYRVRLSYQDVDGFRTCQSDEVDEPVRIVTFTTTDEYDPVQDAYVPTLVQLPAILLDYSKAFSKREAVEAKAEAGDLIAVFGSPNLMPKVGQTLRVENGSRYSGAWQVLKVDQELDAYSAHLRRV